MTSAKAWGIDAWLVSPKEVLELVPFVDESIILGGFYTPSVSVVDSLQAGTLFRERAQAKGALATFANIEVMALETNNRRHHRGRDRPGTHRDRARGHRLRSVEPAVAEMAGASIPLTPAVHQMIDVGPIGHLAKTRKRSITRWSATWASSCTRGRRRARWRSAPTPTVPSCTSPTTFPPSQSLPAVADRTAVHERRLRAADGGRPGAPAGAAGDGGDPVRHQRPALRTRTASRF